MFRVALIEHVDALTRRLFDPDMDASHLESPWTWRCSDLTLRIE